MKTILYEGDEVKIIGFKEDADIRDNKLVGRSGILECYNSKDKSNPDMIILFGDIANDEAEFTDNLIMEKLDPKKENINAYL